MVALHRMAKVEVPQELEGAAKEADERAAAAAKVEAEKLAADRARKHERR